MKITNDCFVLQNLIKNEDQIDQLLKVQDLVLLVIVNEELTYSNEIVQNNIKMKLQLLKTIKSEHDLEIH